MVLFLLVLLITSKFLLDCSDCSYILNNLRGTSCFLKVLLVATITSIQIAREQSNHINHINHILYKQTILTLLHYIIY